MGYKTIRIQRKELYEQVWAKPMTALALEYGLSDVGLRKICKRLSIPLPPKGYHLRKCKQQRPPLPPTKGRDTEHVIHIYEPEQRSVNELVQPFEVPEITFEEMPENRIDVLSELTSIHRHVAEAKTQLKKNKPDRYGRISTSWQRGNDISVFPESVDRAIRIMNTLVMALGKRGFKVSIDEKANATVVKVLEEMIGIRLEERARQVRHVPNPSELRAKKKSLVYSYPTYDYFSTGEFSLSISGANSYEKICKDDKKGNIEGKLNFFIIALIKRALQMKDAKIRRAREEELRQAKAHRRMEMDALIRKEKEKVKTLKEQSDSWDECQKLRRFIHAARGKSPIFDPESDFAKWLVWASLQADRMDPFKKSPSSVLDLDQSYW